MLRHPVALACFLALAACTSGSTGPQGAQGLPGPKGDPGAPGSPGGGLYVSRSDVYCRSATMAAGAFDVTASCDADRDLPLTGSCSATFTSQTFASLSLNSPVQWDSQASGVLAGWMCSWQAASGSEVTVPSGTATICCIRNP